MRALDKSPLAGFTWTSHTLRKGAASAANCIGAPLPVIKYMGDWARKSSVTEGKHIDPAMTPSHAAWQFVGRLTLFAQPHKD
jgi:hypothetical protein